MGELNAVRRHLDVAQGADAQVRDGQLWLRPHPQQPWVAAVRIPAALAARARRWVAAYVAAATQGAPPVTASPASPWCREPPQPPHATTRAAREGVAALCTRPPRCLVTMSTAWACETGHIMVSYY